MTIANSVALSKTEDYIPDDFTESDVQIKVYHSILCTLVGIEHPLLIEYKDFRDCLETHKIRFQLLLIKECGAQQAPVIQLYLLPVLVSRLF